MRVKSRSNQTSRLSQFELETMPHTNDLYRAAARMLQDAEKATDAVQEAYLRAWKSFERREAATDCRVWLFQILFSVVRPERRNWFQWITGENENWVQGDAVASPSIPEAMADSAILEALDRLPERLRAVVLLTDVEDFSHQQASEILQIPLDTTMSRLNRGRLLLAEHLQELAVSQGLAARAVTA